MSNHDGGYIANYVLTECKEKGLFEGKDKSFIADFLVELANSMRYKFDCNESEILEDLDVEYGICSNCSERKADLDNHGHCKECSKYYSY